MKKDYGFGDVGFIIQQIGQLYSSAENAFKEYPVNSVDAFQEHMKENGVEKSLDIGILIDASKKTILMQDNGVGMDYDFLSTIPQKIGLSDKKQLMDLRGEKAFGMLAYQRFAGAIEVCSRSIEEQSGDINYLRMIANQKQYDADKIDAPFFGNLEYGTQIKFTEISDEYLKKYFQPAKLKRSLSKIFSPLLRQDFLNIKVGYLFKDGNRSKLEQVEPIDYSGELVVYDDFDMNFIKHKQQQTGKGTMLIYVDTDKKNGIVNLYNKGIYVGNIALLDELSDNPWKTGKVIGEINEDFMTLVPSREGYVKQPKKRSLFVENIKGLEPIIQSEIKNIKEDKKEHKHKQYAQKIIDSIRKSYENIIGQYFDRSSLTKGRKTDPEEGTVEGEGTTKTRMYGKRKNKEPVTDKKRKTLKPQEDGKKEKVRGGKSNQGNFTVEYTSFDLEDNGLQSKLGVFGNVIMINTDHPNYKSLSNQKDILSYLGIAVCKELAYQEFIKAVDKNKLPPIEQGHTLTELTMGLYVALCNDLKL